MKNIFNVERAKLEMKQRQLADKAGVSRQTISLIEAESYVPSTALAIRISNVLKTTVYENFKLEKDD